MDTHKGPRRHLASNERRTKKDSAPEISND